MTMWIMTIYTKLTLLWTRFDVIVAQSAIQDVIDEAMMDGLQRVEYTEEVIHNGLCD